MVIQDAWHFSWTQPLQLPECSIYRSTRYKLRFCTFELQFYILFWSQPITYHKEPSLNSDYFTSTHPQTAPPAPLNPHTPPTKHYQYPHSLTPNPLPTLHHPLHAIITSISYLSLCTSRQCTTLKQHSKTPTTVVPHAPLVRQRFDE